MKGPSATSEFVSVVKYLSIFAATILTGQSARAAFDISTGAEVHTSAEGDITPAIAAGSNSGHGTITSGGRVGGSTFANATTPTPDPNNPTNSFHAIISAGQTIIYAGSLDGNFELEGDAHYSFSSAVPYHYELHVGASWNHNVVDDGGDSEDGYASSYNVTGLTTDDISYSTTAYFYTCYVTDPDDYGFGYDDVFVGDAPAGTCTMAVQAEWAHVLTSPGFDVTSSQSGGYAYAEIWVSPISQAEYEDRKSESERFGLTPSIYASNKNSFFAPFKLNFISSFEPVKLS